MRPYTPLDLVNRFASISDLFLISSTDVLPRLSLGKEKAIDINRNKVKILTNNLNPLRIFFHKLSLNHLGSCLIYQSFNHLRYGHKGRRIGIYGDAG